MCVLSLQLDLITDLLGTPSLEAMRTACEGAKAHILRGPHKQVQLETAGLSQLGHGSSSVLSSGRDPAAASSQRFTPQSDPRGVFVQTHFFPEPSLSVNRVRVTRGGCGGAVLWVGGYLNCCCHTVGFC